MVLRQSQQIELLINEDLLTNANALRQIHVAFCSADITFNVQFCVRISKTRRTTHSDSNTNAKTVERPRPTLDKPEGSNQTAVREYDDYGANRLPCMDQ